jgi:uncharacterized damage-inducible protein DinB
VPSSNSIVAHHVRQFAWDDWANAEMLASLVTWDARLRGRSTRPASAKLRASRQALRTARLLLAHVVAAELLWLARLAGERSPLPVWPDLDFDTCDERLQQVARTWHDVLSVMRPRDLDRVVRYVNTEGEPWTNTVGDILSHVVSHAPYHRGQIASLARGTKETPAYTDFIHCVRHGWIATPKEARGARPAPASAVRPPSKRKSLRRR